MAAGNPSIDSLLATTIENRNGELVDAYTNNNGFYRWLKMNGRVKTLSGGTEIRRAIAYAENSNAQWYQGLDTLATAATNEFTACVFDWKQLSCAVTISGADERKNSGKEQIIDLVTEKVSVAKGTLTNRMDTVVFGDGTGSGGKEVVGLGAFCVASPSTGTYGGIDRATDTYWRNYASGNLGAASSTTILSFMNTADSSTRRGNDRIDLWVTADAVFNAFEGALQPLQRFQTTKLGEAGFEAYKYKGAEVLNDGGVGGNAPTAVMFGLNTRYIELAVMSGCNMVPLNPNRYPVNQDGYVKHIAWMGALLNTYPRGNAYLKFS